jgi:hypothetical protein
MTGPPTFSALIPFDGVLEAHQPVAPQLVEELAHLGETIRIELVEAPRAVTPFRDEPGLLEDAQVLGDRRTADVEVFGDLADAALVVSDEAQDLPSAREGQGPGCVFHANR